MPRPLSILLLRAIAAWDRLRLRCFAAMRRELEIHPRASSNLRVARFVLAPGARLRIGAGVVTERNPGALRFELGPDAEIEVGENVWLRTDLAPVHLVAFAGARLRVGPENFLNGCHLSAKRSLTTGRRVIIGTGSRVYDSDQHDFDDARPEQTAPIAIGDHVWIASDVTVLRGVSVGEHSVIGTRSVVTRDVPAHSLALGNPARVRGEVGDRSRTR